LVPTDLDWIGILVLSEKYVSEKGIRHALYHLRDAEHIHPTYRLSLALHYHHSALVQTGVVDLLRMPFAVLTATDLRDLEPELTAIINKYRHKITVHRMSLVCHLATFVHIYNCTNHAECESRWPVAYRSCTRQLANPTSSAAGRDILAKFMLEVIPGMNPDCFRITMDTIEASQGFWKEERLAIEAVEEVRELVADQDRLPIFPLRVYNPAL
jgi:hypothetical protein